MIIFIVGDEPQQILFVIVCTIPLREARQGPRRVDALCQRRRRSKFSRRPQRPHSVEAAKLVSHVYIGDGACTEVGVMGRRAGSGWRKAQMKFLAVMSGAKVG